jgi:hypothetical protein
MDDDAQPGSWLADELMLYPVALWQARQIEAGYRGDENGQLAARRFLDRELRELAGWPRGEEYALLAGEYARAGREEDAALLRRIARTGAPAREAAARWNNRYAGRPRTLRQGLASRFRRLGWIDLDPSGPLRGIDGSEYEPGVTCGGLAEEPVLVITSRGMTEMLLGWESYGQMRDWLASRGTTGSAELTWPAPARASRTGQEEIVLARLASHPAEIPVLSSGLVPSAFTADTRYDLYTAIRSAAARAGYCTREAVAAELTRQVAGVPPWALSAYGGQGAPGAHLYLRRLAGTCVTGSEAAGAAAGIRREDKRGATGHAGPAQARGQRQRGAAISGRRQAARQAGPQLLRPGDAPQPGSGPVPQM